MAAFTKREIAFAAAKYVYRDTDHLDIRHGKDGRLSSEIFEDTVKNYTVFGLIFL